MSALLFAVAVAAAVACAFEIGMRRGKALGWQEHYFECVARNRARRQRNGQFKSTRPTA